MPNYDAPVVATIPGDPAALRDAAVAFRRIADTTGEEASSEAAASRATAAGGWQGVAAAAFGTAAGDARARIDTLTRTTHAIPGPLLRFADVLERAQREYAAVQADYQHTAAVIRATPSGAPETQALGDAYFGAQARMDAIIAEVQTASTAAAGEVNAIASQLSDGQIAADKLALTASSSLVGAGFSGAGRAAKEVLGEGTVNGIYTKLGYALTPVTSTLSQLIEDTENPYYSVPERIGRGLGKAVFNGIPDAAAAAAVGGPVDAGVSYISGPLAPLTGTAAGLAAGGAASYYTDKFMSSRPIQDDVVDETGELVDDAAEKLSDLTGIGDDTDTGPTPGGR